MRYNFYILLLSVFWFAGMSCQSRNDVKYFKQFDLFYLNGVSISETKDDSNLVEVKYLDNFPIEILFKKTSRTVLLKFSDSFQVNQKSVYMYHSGNFNGGKPGRQRMYATHNEEHTNVIFISKTDTILSQTVSVSKDRNFSFDLFVKNRSSIDRVSQGEIDFDGKNSSLSISQLYARWLQILQTSYATKSHEILAEIPVP